MLPAEALISAPPQCSHSSMLMTIRKVGFGSQNGAGCVFGPCINKHDLHRAQNPWEVQDLSSPF